MVFFLLINIWGTKFSPSISWHYTAGVDHIVLSSPSVADIDPASPGSEIIFATSVNGQHIYCISSSGDSLWSRDVGDRVYTSPAIANLGASGDPAIIVVNQQGRVWCLNNDGTVRWDTLLLGGTAKWYSSPTIANIDTVGSPEILFGCDAGYLYCLNSDGTEKWKFSCGVVGGASPVVANIDTIGTPEVIFSDGARLYCLDSKGDTMWSRSLSKSGKGYGGVSPSIADIDLDGDPEIVCGDWCFEADGTLRWHYGLPSYSTSAIADVDDDGFPEVVTYCYLDLLLYVLRDNGFGVPPETVWTARAVDASSTKWETPVICDIDCDDDKDVLWEGQSGANGMFQIYDGKTGIVLYENSDLWCNTASEHAAVIADVDNDGKIEIVAIYKRDGVALLEDNSWATCDKNRFSGHLYHITGINSDLSVPKNEPFSWKLHNTWLTQLVDCVSGIDEEDRSFKSEFLEQNYPNPFSEKTIIQFQIPDVRYRNPDTRQGTSNISLTIHDIAGRLIRTFPISDSRFPIHEIVWDGKDESGEKVSPGIYFCSLEAGKFKATRKLTILR